MQTLVSAQTDDDFYKARNKALVNEIQHILKPDEATLISFSDIKRLLKPKNEVYKGMQIVPIKLIVGSEGRFKDFDNQFFPKSKFLKTRWEHIDMAHIQNVPLPPISLYEVGGVYFVRDGNHRVSVAKMRGVENIDADVVSLQSEIKLKPGSSKEDMVRQVINYEKRVFYSETNFGDITDFWRLDFTTPGQYDVIYNHILIHKYYININLPDEIPFEDAVLSWFNNVYLPVIKTITEHHIMHLFSKRTKSDLYIYFIKYWDELKQKFGNDFSLDKAAEDFKHEQHEQFKITFQGKIKNYIAKLHFKRLTNKKNR